ncbi:MAG: hypothetical protein FWD93_05440 [Coriobacteriia bacterium]|nr:hypothetical protein [Coriobacteriia bacterium]
MFQYLSLLVRNCLAVLVIAFILLFPVQITLAAQYAEDVTKVDASEMILEVIPFEAVNHYLARHFNAYSVAVTGFLNPETELPAKVEIAIPAGSDVIWMSEFSGGPLDLEIQFEEPSAVRSEAGLDIYTAVLTQSLALQIEYHIDDNSSPNRALGDGQYAISMEYTAHQDIPFIRLMTNFPAETVVTDPTVEFMGEDAEGYLVFMRVYTDVPAFRAVQGEIVYTPPVGRGMIAEGGNLVGGIGIAAISAAVAIVAAAAFVLASSKRR